MSEFHFLRPDWFWLLLPLAVLLGWLWRRQLRSRSWQAVCEPQLLPYLLLGRSQRRQNWPLYLLLLALLLAVIALAGPVWKRQPQPLFRQQSALILMLDLSASMYATDLKPNRLVRARLKITDILQQRREGQTALVVFAGETFTVTPLTDDSKTIIALLDSLEPGLMPVFGSRPELAIERGRQLLQQAGLAEGDLLLVTDDDQPESAMGAAEELRLNGYRLSVLGVGTVEGAPIPLEIGGFFKDNAGHLVLPQLKPVALQQLATTGGGKYQTLRADDLDLKQLLAKPLRERLESEQQQSDQLGDRWREEGVLLLWPLALLAACAFRRGWLMLIVFCLLLPVPARALDWQQLWQRSDQQGARSFAQGDFKTAKDQFNDHRWQASALYRDGQYAEAAKLLENPETADDYYNLGNALAKTGQLSEALKAYEESLQHNPQDQDVLTNKRLVEEALEQQQQDQDQDQQPQDGEDTEQGDSSSESGEEQQQQSSEQQQGQGETSAGKQQSEEPSETAKPKDNETDKQTEPQQADETQADSKANEADKSEADSQQAQGTRAETDTEPISEEERASQQWLQRIPDDPGGLLRRKFLYQYRQRERRQKSDKQW